MCASAAPCWRGLAEDAVVLAWSGRVGADAGAGAARSSPSDVDARFSAPEGKAGGFGLQPLAANDGFLQCLARLAPSGISPRFVDFIFALGRIRQDEHVVPSNLQKAAADGERLLGAAVLDAHDARD